MAKKPSKGEPSGSKDPWSIPNIVQAARTTGKPFEVQTAIELYKRGWSPILGTYYHDVTTEAAREIDVLAGKEATIDAGGTSIGLSVRIFASCKAYPEECRPVIYSHAHDATGSSYAPDLPCNRGGFESGGFNVDPWSLLPFDPPFLQRQVAGFDVYEAIAGGSLKAVGDRQMKGGRESLYPALDSALKAAIYWYEVERTIVLPPTPSLHVYVPLLVSKKDWVHISLDSDQPTVLDEPIPPFKTVLYPFKGRGTSPEVVTSLICSASNLPAMIGYLDTMFQELKEFLNRCAETHKRQSRRKET